MRFAQQNRKHIYKHVDNAVQPTPNNKGIQRKAKTLAAVRIFAFVMHVGWYTFDAFSMRCDCVGRSGYMTA
jgi:hypothetical protein